MAQLALYTRANRRVTSSVDFSQSSWASSSSGPDSRGLERSYLYLEMSTLNRSDYCRCYY